MGEIAAIYTAKIKSLMVQQNATIN